MKRLRILLLIFLNLLAGQSAIGAEFPAQGRIFLVGDLVDPAQMNSVAQSAGLSKVDKYGFYGAEITMPALGIFHFGFRYQHHNHRANQSGSTVDTSEYAVIVQDAVLGVARVTLMSSPILRLDVFGGIGGANTKFTMTTASQNGELTKKANYDNGFASLTTAYGASASIGYNWVFLFLELGVTQNKVSGFDRTGNISNNLQEIDMSGSYAMIGLRFDGIKANKK